MDVATGDWFDLPRAARAPRPIWAIGDVHGCTDHLGALYRFLHETVREPGLLVHLGDYVDRGRDSPGALSMVRKGPGIEALEGVSLRGNHDQYLIDGAGLEGGVETGSFDNWLAWGGESTFDDLATDPLLDPEARAAGLRASLGPDRIAFLRSTPLMHREGDILFAHAGLNPARAFDAQTPDDLMFVRKAFIECPADEWPFEPLVVHGHTPAALGVDHHRIGGRQRVLSLRDPDPAGDARDAGQVSQHVAMKKAPRDHAGALDRETDTCVSASAGSTRRRPHPAG